MVSLEARIGCDDRELTAALQRGSAALEPGLLDAEAYENEAVETAKKKLQQLANWLDSNGEGSAAASLREGPGEAQAQRSVSERSL